MHDCAGTKENREDLERKKNRIPKTEKTITEILAGDMEKV